MKKIIYLLSKVIIFTTLSFQVTHADKKDTINIATLSWPSQLVGVEIICKIFEKVGEKCHYIFLDKHLVFESLDNGSIDIVHEIWEVSQGQVYDRILRNSREIEEISTYDAKTKEGWWYPEYVEKICPGLPQWKALIECSDKFTRPDSNNQGVLVTGPKDWRKYEEQRIKALGINFIVKNTDSAIHVWHELESAFIQKRPIIVFNWSPNFVEVKYKGKFIELPKFEIDCITDPSWGINPTLIYDCGYQNNKYIKLAANVNFKYKNPKAYKILKQINFSNNDLSKMTYYIDVQGMDLSGAAQKWLKDNKSRWNKWIN